MCEKEFYKKAANYWAHVPATVDGVLCGFGFISETDIKGSKAFLDKIFNTEGAPGKKLALDCGAGIGRVTKHLLFDYFDKVDLVEQDSKFITTARQSIGEDNAKLGTLYKIGLQHFKPHKKYDVIWCQWVLGHLNDNDLLTFLERCKEALNKNGILVIKENITTTDEKEFDDEDSAVTRPMNLMQKMFHEAQLKLVMLDIQSGFPEDIYPVFMFALSPLPNVSRVQIV